MLDAVVPAQAVKRYITVGCVALCIPKAYFSDTVLCRFWRLTVWILCHFDHWLFRSVIFAIVAHHFAETCFPGIIFIVGLRSVRRF